MIRFLGSHTGKIFTNVFISVAAAVVILGALGKILHASWGSVAITAGMLTECVIFLMLAFVPVDHHPHWDRYFPDLYKDTYGEKKKGELGFQPVTFLQERGGAGGQAGDALAESTIHNADQPNANQSSASRFPSGNPALDKLEDMLEQADITPTNLKKLADSFEQLNVTVSHVADVASSNTYIHEFANQTKETTEALSTLKETYLNVAKQFNSGGFVDGVRNFYEQMQGITKNISSLNAIYGVEIKDTLDDIKKVRKYFNSIDVVASQLNDSVEEVKMTKQQISQLVNNLSGLNTVYGNMLSVMQAPGTKL